MQLSDVCLGCSACVAACPVVASDGRFAGPKVLGPALDRRLGGGWPGDTYPGPSEASALGAEHCLQCHQCDLACPSGFPVSRQVLRAKVLARLLSEDRSARSPARLVADQERFGRWSLAAAVPRRAARKMSRRLAVALERAGLSLLGLSRARSLPDPPRYAFAAWFAATRRPDAERDRPPVLLFAGCHVRFHDPSAGLAAVRVLRASGFKVALPDQVCCGSPALGLGEETLARAAAMANLRLLSRASERLGVETPVVATCPSCTVSLRLTLLDLAPRPEAERLAARVWDLGEFLAGPARAGLVRALGRSATRSRVSDPESSADAGAGPAAWVYHTSCHVRFLGVGRPFPTLLEELDLGRPLDPGPEADGCCGMGGLTGLTRDGHGRSLAAGARVIRAYRALRGEGESPVLASDCSLCRWQLAEATGLVTAHPVELLARALPVGQERLRKGVCTPPSSEEGVSSPG